MDNPRAFISVIVPVSRPLMAQQCLEAFSWQNTTQPFEVIMVGNVDGIEPPAWPFRLKLIGVGEPHANVRRNAGLSLASANLIAFMDDDALPDTHWVDTALAFHQKHPQAVFTGPERPLDSSLVAVTTHQVLSSPLSELHRGHINTSHQQVKWHELPFCNCVMPRALLEESGGLSTSIPWDMDDFHFFFPYRHRAIFYNLPELTIQHDRYPDSLSSLFKYKWGLRLRTGEKLVTHAYIYWRIWPVAIALLSPYVLLGLLCLLSWQVLWVLSVLYLLCIAVVSAAAVKPLGPTAIASGVVILGGIHAITIIAMQVGFWKQLAVSVLGNVASTKTANQRV